MTIHDFVNCLFEFFAGLAILMHCREAKRVQNVAGVSVWATVFFAAWGMWNLVYYPILGQWTSFIAGMFVMYANLLWIKVQFDYNPALKDINVREKIKVTVYKLGGWL